MKIELSKAIRAGYNYFYCQSFETERTVDNIKAEIDLIDKADWKLLIWDFSTSGDPDEIIEKLQKSPSYTAVVAKNLHWFLQEPNNGKLNYSLVQYLQTMGSTFSSKANRKALIIVGDSKFDEAIPACLQKLFISVNFPLPNAEEIEDIMDMIIQSANKSPNVEKEFKPSKEERKEIVKSALGLTKQGVSNAMAYSVIQTNGKIDSKIVADIRCAEISETSGLRIGIYDDLNQLLGYQVAKEFIERSINNPKSRGCLILGPPGTGKTHLAKWASTIANKIMIEFELAQVQGSGLYGQAEAAMGNAIEVIKAVGESLLFIDEIEKAVPGKESTNDTTGTRSFGQLLKFLSDDRPAGCYVMATCNDISKLPPEWVRSERFDVLFFVDLPTMNEISWIYDYYKDLYEVESGGFTENDMLDWTGAEIKTACRLANILNSTVKEAAKYVVPVSKTMSNDIDYLRNWAKDRTIPASLPAKTNKLSRVRAID